MLVFISLFSIVVLLILIVVDRLRKKLLIQLMIRKFIRLFLKLCNSFICDTLSNASLTFRNRIDTIFLLFHVDIILFINECTTCSIDVHLRFFMSSLNKKL